MRHLTVSLGVLALVATSMAACTTKPTIPEIFSQQLTRFLEEGAKTSAMTELGVTYPQLREQVATTKGAYDLAVATWPDDFALETRSSFDRSFEAWQLALDLWGLDIGDKDNPVESNINGFRRYVDFAGDVLVLETHTADFIVEEYRGKRYLPFDENISILLTIAPEAFDEGKTEVLAALQ